MGLFFGFVTFDDNLDFNAIGNDMLKSISYFTPNKQKTYSHKNIYLHNSILANRDGLDESAIYETEQFVIAGICRLDNKNELKNKLNISIDLCDMLYILKAYEKYSNDCLMHLIGDFSFVIWDKINHSIFLAKDQLGIKPLFFALHNNVFYFATNISSIKAAIKKNLTVNQYYLATELKNYPQQISETIFNEIKRLKPAHSISYGKNGLGDEKKYWDLKKIDVSNFRNEIEITNEFHRLFSQAIKSRTRTTKNIAVQLSGGLDSSAITYWLSKLVDKSNIHTYSFVLDEETLPYSNTGVDEQNTQEIILNHTKLNKNNHHKITKFHYTNIYHEFHESFKIMGGFANSDCIWQDSMFKKQQENEIGISFSGFPGDELISNSGYLYYYDYIYNRQFYNLWKDFKIKSFHKIVKYLISKTIGNYNWKYYKLQNQRNLLNKLVKLDKKLKDTSFKFQPSYKLFLKNHITRTHNTLRMESEGAYAIQYGIETVYPLADIRLIEFVYSLPTYYFKPKPLSRMFFRKMCKDILPTQIVNQPKFNGANTLAFSDYWRINKFNELKDYELKDELSLFVSEINPKLTEVEKAILRIHQCKIDYFLVNLMKK
jgi:asparagine synthase (glutamine-hydrolysing)